MTAEFNLNLPEINCSYGNFFDKSVPENFLVSFDSFLNVLKEAGYEGFEWHLIRSRANLQLQLGMVSGEGKNSIASLHQSYRSEKNIFEALRHPNKALAVMSYFVLPERLNSLDEMLGVQYKIGRRLPAVLYAAHSGETEPTNREFAEKLFQPTPDIMQRWQVKNAEDLIKKAQEKGFTGFCLDLSHIRSNQIGEYTLEPWRENLPKLLPFTREIHISAGRIDQPYYNTLSELKDLLRGTEQTELSAMLKLIMELRYSGRFVTEIPAQALKILANNSKFSMDTLIRNHEDIVYNLRVLLS